MLIASRAFVVQIDTLSDLGNGPITGRIDHIVSGESHHFANVADLLAFIVSILAQHACAAGEAAHHE